MIEQQLIRWVKASVYKHFNELQPAHKLLYYTRQRSIDHSEYFELRLTGPQVTQITRKDWRIDLTVDLLIRCEMTTNIYRIEDLKGIGAQRFTECIPVHRYGPATDVENDDSWVENLTAEDAILITDFGEHENGKVLHSALERDYRMFYRKG